MKFHFNSFNGCQVTERTQNRIVNDQKEIQSRVMVLVHDTLSHFALQVLKFQPNSFNSVQLTEQIRNCIYLRSSLPTKD